MSAIRWYNTNVPHLYGARSIGDQSGWVPVALSSGVNLRSPRWPAIHPPEKARRSGRNQATSKAAAPTQNNQTLHTNLSLSRSPGWSVLEPLNPLARPSNVGKTKLNFSATKSFINMLSLLAKGTMSGLGCQGSAPSLKVVVCPHP